MQAFAVAALSIWLCLGATALAESHGPQPCSKDHLLYILLRLMFAVHCMENCCYLYDYFCYIVKVYQINSLF